MDGGIARLAINLTRIDYYELKNKNKNSEMKKKQIKFGMVFSAFFFWYDITAKSNLFHLPFIHITYGYNG